MAAAIVATAEWEAETGRCNSGLQDLTLLEARLPTGQAHHDSLPLAGTGSEARAAGYGSDAFLVCGFSLGDPSMCELPSGFVFETLGGGGGRICSGCQVSRR